MEDSSARVYKIGSMKKIIIDTTDKDKIAISLKLDEKVETSRSKRTNNSQQVLPMIVEILGENKMRVEDLEAIDVDLGPGSFTGIRVGISIANALGEVLKIPVNGKRQLLVAPKYK